MSITPENVHALPAAMLRQAFHHARFGEVPEGCEPSAIGCAHQPAARPVEPTAAPASIDRLTCGGRSCSITQAGGATLVWVQE